MHLPPATWFDPNRAVPLAHQPLIARLATQDVVLLGETHTRYDIHRWQLAVATALHAHRPIAIGFEMFQRRQQAVLDAFLAGAYATKAEFLAAAEWGDVWRYNAELYWPIFHFCRAAGVPMLALNCNRALVTRVGKEGWGAIPVDERDGLTPARPALPPYRDYLDRIAGPSGRASDPASIDRFVRAQQTWDRAFAVNIARALARPEPRLVVGIIGRGHLEYGYGTPFQLADLGVERVSILLPTDEDFDPVRDPAIADALFRLPPDLGG
jgi:uncharacterized iron-regulated protein